MNRNQHKLLAKRTRQDMHRSYLRLLKPLQNEMVAAVHRAASAYPSWKATLGKHRANLSRILKPELTRVVLMISKRTYEEWIHPIKLDTQDQLEERVMNWMAEYCADEIVDISETTKQRIINAIMRGQGQNMSPRQIASLIRDEVGDMSYRRAETIARTETATAVSTAQHMAMEDVAEETGMDFNKRWNATQDERTREDHADADDQVVPMDEPFIVGGEELDHPSDPDGSAEQVINCRCVETFETVKG